MRMGAGEEARRQSRRIRSARAGCARAARRRFRSPITPIASTQPLKRTRRARQRPVQRRSPGTRRSRSWSAQLDALAAAERSAVAGVPDAAAARPPRSSWSRSSCSASARRRRSTFELFGDDVLRRANAHELRPRAAADVRSRARALRDLRSAPTSSAPGTRRSRRASAYGADAAGPPGHARRRSCRSSRACRRPARTPTSGCR